MAIRRHKKTRGSCFWCSVTHSVSQHSSHGSGSYARIHKPKKKTKKKRR